MWCHQTVNHAVYIALDQYLIGTLNNLTLQLSTQSHTRAVHSNILGAPLEFAAGRVPVHVPRGKRAFFSRPPHKTGRPQSGRSDWPWDFAKSSTANDHWTTASRERATIASFAARRNMSGTAKRKSLTQKNRWNLKKIVWNRSRNGNLDLRKKIRTETRPEPLKSNEKFQSPMIKMFWFYRDIRNPKDWRGDRESVDNNITHSRVKSQSWWT